MELTEGNNFPQRTSSLADRIVAAGAKLHARRQLGRFQRAVQHAASVQERVLHSIIRRNRDSAYGRDHQFNRIASYQDFVSHVPIQTYDDLRPYVQRVLDGDLGAMFGPGQRVLMFSITSGTADKPKYVPVTPAFLNAYRRGWNVYGVKAVTDHDRALCRGILQVASRQDEHRTPFNIPCGAISGLLVATQKRIVRKYYVVPRKTAYIADPAARYYTIMRYAITRDVAWMITANPATHLTLAKAAASNAERLIRDIHDGTLRPPGDIPDEVLRELMVGAAPNPVRAKQLEAVAAKHGEMLPKDYWDLSFLSNWTGGTLSLHLREFPHYFGVAPVRDIGLLATEGRMSIPLVDGSPGGVLDVEGSFFEFIDVEASAPSAPAIRRCHELVSGREYKILLTTAAGFYRYDIGDHIRVLRLEGQAPVIEFLHRGAHSASITGEKLTEWQVIKAFDRCCARQVVSGSSFVLCPVWGDPPNYRLHTDDHGVDPKALARAFDEELCTINVEYHSKRSSDRLGSVVVHVLPSGTLGRLDADKQRARGTSHEQFKHRYLYATPGDDDFLISGSDPTRTEPKATAGSPSAGGAA